MYLYSICLFVGHDMNAFLTGKNVTKTFEIHSSNGNSTQLDITIINDVMTSIDCVVSGTSLTWLFVFSSAKHVFKMDNLPRPAITFHEFIT